MAIKTLEDAREFVYGQPSLQEWRDALREANQCRPKVIDYLLEHCIMQDFVIWSEGIRPLHTNLLHIKVEKAGTVFQIGDYVRPRRDLVCYAPYGPVSIHENDLAEVTHSHPNGNLMVRLITIPLKNGPGALQTNNEDWERVSATDIEPYGRRERLG